MSEQDPAPMADGRRSDGVPELAWPVGAVADRLGVAASTLRSWDRRHGVGPTSRTDGRHRRYSESDVRRVMLMSRLTANGIPAQSAADALAAMDDETVDQRLNAGSAESATLSAVNSSPSVRATPATPAAPATVSAAMEGSGAVVDPSFDGSTSGSAVIDSIVAAAEALDSQALSVLYRQNLRQHDVADAWSDVFAPALRRIGDLWANGHLGIEAEHLASELLQSELRGVSRANRLRLVGPPVMLANADEENHHLPLLALEAGLAGQSVASLFLGSRLPTSALIDAVTRTRPRVLFLWASLARRHREPLWDGLRVVDWPMSVVIGGPGWPARIEPRNSHVSLSRVDDFHAAVQVLVDANGPSREARSTKTSNNRKN